MLLEFRFSNYKSFLDEAVLSMVPAPKQHGLDYSVHSTELKIGNRKTKVRNLCSSVIYGPNAAGKTTVISALDMMRSIFLKGNIKDGPGPYNFMDNVACDMLELVPNDSVDDGRPVKMDIKFVCDGIMFEYSLSMDLGKFMEREYKRRILEEDLSINGEPVFSRKKESLSMGDLDKIKDQFDVSKGSASTALNIAEKSLTPEELFLSNGFKNVYGTKVFPVIEDFFKNRLWTFCNSQNKYAFPDVMECGKLMRATAFSEIARAFGSDSSDLMFYKDKDKNHPILLSRVKRKTLPAFLMESLGTLRILNMFPALFNALRVGGTVVLDEFDNSLHPMAVMSIINIFHDEDLNKNNAQLIFNSQNPIYLTRNMFRRDEIKFVDRASPEKGASLYSLSDFGSSARKGKDYMKDYFIDRYGAIRDIDLSGVFEKFLNEADHAEEKK